MLVDGTWKFSPVERSRIEELIAYIHDGKDSAWERLDAIMLPYLEWRNNHVSADSEEWRDSRLGAVWMAYRNAAIRFRAGGNFLAYLSVYLKRPLSWLTEADEMQADNPSRRRLIELRKWCREFLAAIDRDPTLEEAEAAFPKWPDVEELYRQLRQPDGSLDVGWDNEDGERPDLPPVPPPDPPFDVDRAIVALLDPWRDACRQVLQECAQDMLPLFEARYGAFFAGEQPRTLEQTARDLPPYSGYEEPTEYRMDVLVREQQMLAILHRAGLFRDASA